MDPVIRPIRAEDAAAVYEIRRQPLVQRFTTSMPTERPGDFLSRFGPNDHVLVAEIDGRVIAMAGLHVKDGKHRHCAWLGLAVHDAFAGRGVGKALMAALVDLADNWIGLMRMELEVFANNDRAIAMYRHLGFVEEGRQRKAYFSGGQYIDALLMARVR